MPHLACWSCGRSLYTVSPLESLFPDERRCPRCGAFLRNERRTVERRTAFRRVGTQHDLDPAATEGERRRGDRRKQQRRASGEGGAGHGMSRGGWVR